MSQLVSNKHMIRFASLNARTLSPAGEAELLAAELAEAGVAVCGIQEARLRGHGRRSLTAAEGQPDGQAPAGWTLLWSGGTQRRNGVAALLSPAASRAVVSWNAVSDRLLSITLAGTVTATVLVGYAPTNPSPLPAKDAFYRQL